MTTRKQKADQELGGEIGSYGGMAAGGIGGYQAAHGARRLGTGARSARTSYKFSRQLAGLTQGGGRARDAGTALRTGASAARHTSHHGVARGALAASTLGVVGGGVGGYKGGKKAVAMGQQRKKVAKMQTMDQIAKVGYVPNPEKINTTSGKKHQAANVAGALGAGAGGFMLGHRAGELGAEHYYSQPGGGARQAARSIGHGYKGAVKTKLGAAGAGLAAAGIGTSMAVRHSAKKKGIIIPAKKPVQKSDTRSAFGVQH